MNTKFLKQITFAACTLLSFSANANLITNGSFETGNFSGWSITNNGGTGGCGTNVWVVNSTGQHGCTNNGTSVNAPVDGSFGAFNTFDGQAANYTLSQTITLPGSVLSATLSFMDAFRMSHSQALRTFRVDLYDASNTTLIGNFFSEQPAVNANQSWVTHTIDATALIAAQAGNTVTLRFSNIIPQAYTGPGGFGIDGISLVAEIPEPATLALLGLGLLGFGARRRKQ